MGVYFNILLVTVGFVLLIKGADFLVNGASSLAKRFNVSDIAIGLTVVAMGTSAPELVVNIISGTEDLDDVIFGNIIGSNIFNVFLILGISSVIYPLTVQRNALWKEVPYSLFITIVFFFLVNDVMFGGDDPLRYDIQEVQTTDHGTLFKTEQGHDFEVDDHVRIDGSDNVDGIYKVLSADSDKSFTLHLPLEAEGKGQVLKSENYLSTIDAIILMAFFVLFLIYIFINLKRHPEEAEGDDVVLYGSVKTTVMIVLGIAGLIFGGQMIVENAVIIAKSWGMSEKLIGLTILAAGTSLPELATSAVAAFQKKSDLAVGNIVGSNVFNLLLVIGSTALINGGLAFNTTLNIDIYFMILGTFLLFVFMFTLNKYKLDRAEGFVYLLFFAAYMYYIISRT